MEEKTIYDRAGALIDRFALVKDAYIKSAFDALVILDADTGSMGTDWMVEHDEIVAEMGAVMRGYDRAFAWYESSTRAFWGEYGAAEGMTDLDVLLDVLMEGGEPDVR